jgi:hypothetical protein
MYLLLGGFLVKSTEMGDKCYLQKASALTNVPYEHGLYQPQGHTAQDFL